MPYITLRLKDDQSLEPEDTGLYTCLMPDINSIEREAHIWILEDQDFSNAFSTCIYILINFYIINFLFVASQSNLCMHDELILHDLHYKSIIIAGVINSKD